MKTLKIMTVLLFLLHSSVMQAGGSHTGGHTGQDSSHWMAPVAEAAVINPVKSTDDSILQGAKLYQQNCASCHGSEAEGDGQLGLLLKPRPANLKAMSGKHTDGDFAYKIKFGRGQMPGWRNTLDERKVWHLVNFIQSLSPTRVVDKKERGLPTDSMPHQHN